MSRSGQSPRVLADDPTERRLPVAEKPGRCRVCRAHYGTVLTLHCDWAEAELSSPKSYAVDRAVSIVLCRDVAMQGRFGIHNSQLSLVRERSLGRRGIHAFSVLEAELSAKRAQPRIRCCRERQTGRPRPAHPREVTHEQGSMGLDHRGLRAGADRLRVRCSMRSARRRTRIWSSSMSGGWPTPPGRSRCRWC